MQADAFLSLTRLGVRQESWHLVVVPNAFLTGHRVEIVSLAARYRLPAIYPFRFFAESGGLLSYGNDLLDNYRRAAIYANRILKGAKPSVSLSET